MFSIASPLGGSSTRPSLQSVLAAAERAQHYEVFGPNGIRISAIGREDHELAVEAIQRLGWDTPIQTVERESPAPVVPVAKVEPPVLAVEPDVVEEKPVVASLVPPCKTGRAVLFSEFAAVYVSNMERGDVRDKSVKRSLHDYRLFERIVGDKPLQDITSDDIKKFIAIVCSWPANIQNRNDFKGLSPEEVVAKGRAEGIKIIKKETQGHYLSTLNALFAWCLKKKHMQEDPMDQVDLDRFKARIVETRELFTLADLHAIFDKSRAATFVEPFKFWAPIIAFYTGMRVREIAQLYLNNIVEEQMLDEDGNPIDIVYFDIKQGQAKQSVKSKHSVRRVPLHQVLLDLGFMEYVADVRKAGFKTLFPELMMYGDDPGAHVTKWFSKYLREVCLVESKKKVFHCFRHLLTTRATFCLVPNKVIDTINGHGPGFTIRDKYYVIKAKVTECKKFLEKIVFPKVSLLPYVPGRFEAHFKQVRDTLKHEEVIRTKAKGEPVKRKKGRPQCASKTKKVSEKKTGLGQVAAV